MRMTRHMADFVIQGQRPEVFVVLVYIGCFGFFGRFGYVGGVAEAGRVTCRDVTRSRGGELTDCILRAEGYSANLIRFHDFNASKTCTAWKCGYRKQATTPKSVFGEECADRGSKVLHSRQVSWGAAGRAQRTAPEGVSIRASSIPGAGRGAFTDIPLEAGTMLGEYEGDVDILLTEGTYKWQITSSQGRAVPYTVDAFNPRTSSWARYINCARFPRELNVEMRQCRGKVFYWTAREVRPGEELLVYYGAMYAKALGIDPTLFECDGRRPPS